MPLREDRSKSYFDQEVNESRSVRTTSASIIREPAYYKAIILAFPLLFLIKKGKLIRFLVSMYKFPFLIIGY